MNLLFCAHQRPETTRFCYLNQQVSRVEDQPESVKGADIRNRIGDLLHNQEFLKTIDDEAREGYEELATGREKYAIDEKNLKSFYKVMNDGFENVKKGLRRIEDHAKKAIDHKVATDNDRDFLFAYIYEHHLNGKQNVTQETLDALEKRVVEEINQLTESKKEYDQLTETDIPGYILHELPRDQRAAFASEAGFLKLIPKEKKKFLEQLKKAHEKAEKVRKDEERDYAKLLDNPNMGKATRAKYLEEFKGLNLRKERREWMDELKNGNQLERYEDLWDEIESTFKGTPFLAKLKAMQDSLGHTELNDAFHKMKASELEKLNRGYQYQLDQHERTGVISAHTKQSYLDDFADQDFAGKYDYVRQLPMQMRRYEVLRHQIDQLDDAYQEQIDALYSSDTAGYTEIHDWYQSVSGKSIDEAAMEDAPDAIDFTSKRITQLTDSMDDDAYCYAVEWMLKMPIEVKKDLYRILRGYFQDQSQDMMETEFQDDVQMEMDDLLDDMMADELEEHDLVEPDVADSEEAIKSYILENPDLDDELAEEYDALDDLHEDAEDETDQSPGLWQRLFRSSDYAATDEFKRVQKARRVAQDPELAANDEVSVDVDRLTVNDKMKKKQALDHAYVRQTVGDRNVVRFDVGYEDAVKHFISDHQAGVPKDTSVHLIANERQRKVEFGEPDTKRLLKILELDLHRTA